MPSTIAGREIRLLLVEPERSAAGRHERFAPAHWCVTTAADLSTALETLGHASFDVVLFALDEAGSADFDALEQLALAAGAVPIVATVRGGEDRVAEEAVRRGAQDCLRTQPLDTAATVRAVRLAIVRKAAESRQAEHLRRLESANSRLNEFGSIVSHDLKEPLSGIRAYCELLGEEQSDQLDDEALGWVGSMQSQCDRMAAMLDSLRTYCRTDRPGLLTQRVDMNDVVASVLEGLHASIRAFGGEVRVVGQLPVVRGNPDLIGLVFSNLIINGLKFNENHRPLIEIGTGDGDPSALYVRDNGIGIAAKDQRAVFEMFRRLHGRKRFDGTGAGLAIVQRIVNAHGGRIDLDSEPGSGTIFRFTLGQRFHEPTPPPHWSPRSAVSLPTRS